MIRSKELTKAFGSHTAVCDVSLDIGRGELVAVLGPNGAGKSTLIRLLCGLTEPDAGTISVAGLQPRSLELRRIIGVVPDELGLLPELTIAEQLAMSGPIYGLDRDTTQSRAEELLQALALDGLRHTYARDCSHGMRKKTALAMALLHNPAVVMLDEPFEGIDPNSAETISALLRAITRRGVTVLLTSHILPMVDRIADRVVVMREGRIASDTLAADLPHGSMKLYFDQVEAPVFRDIEWLRSPL